MIGIYESCFNEENIDREFLGYSVFYKVMQTGV